MVKVEDHIVEYFKAPQNYFWDWQDHGAVIAWQDGNTICYRDDLLSLLAELSDNGLPPLSALLLLFAVCREPLHPQHQFFLKQEVIKFTRADPGFDIQPVEKMLDEAIDFLAIVAGLPENLRSGPRRIQLAYEIFNAGSFTIANRQFKEALPELNSGRADEAIVGSYGASTSREAFMQQLGYFSDALNRFPTTQALIMKLRTGLDQLPAATATELPDPSGLNIFDQLLQDDNTRGIARLAKRLIATLNIPMQAKGSSDQPFGGISDITNRGNYDKLLLSELAYDDELLMARLVNNEALYFRREQPPEQPKLQRIILMDTTLKMWGTSRVFALAAGLACAQSNKHTELLQAYCLGGTKFTAVNLGVKTGIIQALEILDHSLHCGNALETVMQSLSPHANHEVILITDARLLHSASFHASLSIVKAALSFVIAVSNTGELKLYEYVNGISKQISTAKVDVDEILTSPANNNKTPKKSSGDIPAFLSCKPSPLYFPSTRVKISPEKTFVKNLFGTVVVTEAQRVLFNRKEGKGVLEILNYVEKGNYYFSVSGQYDALNILVSNPNRKLLKLYKINLINSEHTSIDLINEITFFSRAAFQNDLLYLQTNNAVLVYNCISEKLIDKKGMNDFNKLFYEPRSSTAELHNQMRVNKSVIENENIFYRVNMLYLNNKRQLVIGNHVLTLYPPHIRFKPQYPESNRHQHAKLSEETLSLVKNKNIKFNAWVWGNGSEAVVDSRGLLHLKSADPGLPEITLVMVLNRVTACWASDGTATGSAYFINEQTCRIIPAQDFYDQYIQKYINQLA